MSWGVDLWDQYDNLALHTHRGIEFLDRYGQFMKERCNIEQEYANKLKKLIKNYVPKKINEDEYYKGSSCRAFYQMTKEIADLAGQHELIAENLTTYIAKEISMLVKELKEERKKYLHEGAKLQNNLQVSLAQLEKAKRTYEKAFKESEKAQDNYIKADADINLSRAEVEKAKTIANMKNHVCEVSKNDYANHLQKTNEWQRLHYSEYMPNIFQQLQDMEERRISCIQNYMKQSADIHHQVLPIMGKCLDGIIEAAESIDPKRDSELVSDMYKTGLSPPEDIPFEDLSNMKISDQTGNGHTIQSKTDTVRGTITAGKLKKRGGIFGIFSSNKHNFDEFKEDYSDLPPNQRKKKLQQKIDCITFQIQQETGARDGLMKMKEAYEKNPAMGDPLTVEGQLAENGHNLEKLQVELQKYQTYMAEADGKVSPSQRRHRSSLSEDSLSRSASDSSVSNPYLTSNNNQKNHVTDSNSLMSHGNSNSPESGIGMSHPSLPDDDYDEFDDYNTEFDAEPLPVLGTARALYAFDSQSDGSISIYEGEEFEVVELDQGDGWTRVRKSNLDEGFVPTSYIEVFVYNNC